jgi:hypothetical protein
VSVVAIDRDYAQRLPNSLMKATRRLGDSPPYQPAPPTTGRLFFEVRQVGCVELKRAQRYRRLAKECWRDS